jgi:ATP-dependent DNA helicase RecG
VVTRRALAINPVDILTRLKELFGARFGKFTKLEVQALVTADIEGAVDNARMRQITGGHASDMTRMLQGLVARGVLNQEGQGRWTRYRLPGAAGTAHRDMDSVPLGGHSVHKGIDSVHKGIDSVHSVSHSRVDGSELIQIAAPARRSQRLPPEQMENIILDLCRERWLTRRELAGILQRNPDNLRSRFLTPMVAHGLLRLRYPDKPNRVDQAYSAATEEE